MQSTLYQPVMVPRIGILTAVFVHFFQIETMKENYAYYASFELEKNNMLYCFF